MYRRLYTLSQLKDVLPQIAAQLQLDVVSLAMYAAEDNIPGSLDAPSNAPGRDPYAIPYGADGKFLYALVRALKPDRVLESGTSHGGSANHIAAALKRNGFGRLVTVDILPDSGQHILPEYQDIVEVVHEDITFYVQRSTGAEFQFIHEDAAHSAHSVHAVYGALSRLMPFGGVIVSHDTAYGVREDIMRGIRNAGFNEPPCYVWEEESPCGFSVMHYKGV